MKIIGKILKLAGKIVLTLLAFLFVCGTSCLRAGLSCDLSADQESLYADSRIRTILYGEGELWKEHTIYGENVLIVK